MASLSNSQSIFTGNIHLNRFLKPLLILLSTVYGSLVWLRNLLYDIGVFKTHRVDSFVISVGNLSVGGSGKTVLTQALLEYFTNTEISVAVLSRGYGRKSKGLVTVSDGRELLADAGVGGDEPVLLARKFPSVPVIVSENRVFGAQYLMDKYHPDVIILDDAFQHRRLGRDLDILLLDFAEKDIPRLLPAGRLREPFSGRERAHVVLFSKQGLGGNEQQNFHLELEDFVVDWEGRQHPYSQLDDPPGAFAAIGNPGYFFESISEKTATSEVQLSFQDHAEYTPQNLDLIESHNCNCWITTEKDYVKLEPEFCRRNKIYFAPVKAVLPPALFEHLKNHFK